MNYLVHLYRGPQFEYAFSLRLFTLAQASLTRLFGWKLDDAQLRLLFYKVPSDAAVTGEPTVLNLYPEFGYVYVTVKVQGQIIYQHPHPIEELVTFMLQNYLREKYPEETLWAFRVDVPGIGPVAAPPAERPTPQVSGVMELRPFAPGEKPRFSIRRLDEPPPAPAKAGDFGVTPADEQAAAKVKVLLPPALIDDLCRGRPLSKEVEEGGFLVGRVFEDAEHPGTFLVRITRAPNAEQTGASLLHFTFTGDSFAAVKQDLRASAQGERLVGWYHTHLFAATETMGLSSIDVTLHLRTFTIPWQLAGLINLDETGRTLRFYVREGEQMIQCPYFPIEEPAP